MASDDDVNLLVIVVDVNPIWWGQQALSHSVVTLPKCIDAVMVMGNSHLFMGRNNKLAVIASHLQESRLLFPGKQWRCGDLTEESAILESNASGSKDGKYELLTAANDLIADEIKDLMTKSGEIKRQRTDTVLAGSLAKALCYINRISKESKAGEEVKSRILVIKAAEDSALQYMNFMNVIFAAQKQNILIDACVLDTDSGLLQQKENVTSTDLHCPFKGIEESKLSVNRKIVREYLANINEFKSPGPDELHPRVLKEIIEEILEPLSIIFENSWRTGEVPEDWRRANVVPIFKKGKKVDPGNYRPACDITGGLYLKIPQVNSLLQYLLWVFLPDPDQRSQLNLPPPVHVDYRAACFCHRNLIEIGYVCSVCLSIFCNFSPICTTCETAFKISLPPVMKAKKKKLKPLF
ncbi:general transcription factor IIH subunit 3 isoform X1 [Phyllobates terribilis]|uniref:general transcription factor IIH subunit 3 isoform X1 n=1 Tax=Phyllobates terribilis TaxID=111132 RepID=UPI003CCAA4B3